jgi:hypothetical protein
MCSTALKSKGQNKAGLEKYEKSSVFDPNLCKESNVLKANRNCNCGNPGFTFGGHTIG